jgi:formate transporter
MDIFVDDVAAGPRANTREFSTFSHESRGVVLAVSVRSMDYVTPHDTIREAVSIAVRKASLSRGQMLLRGALAGGILAYATSLALIITAQGLPPIVAAICFPAGFVVLVLLGLELATGNFALLPIGFLDRRVTGAEVARNWAWVYTGNLLGSIAYAVLFFLAITSFGTSNGAALGDQVRKVAQAKTLAYQALGASGWATAFVKALLCNWMVTLGALLALMSRSTLGKIVAMWLPIAMFFAQGYEHSIVNMFVIPAGMLLGAPVHLSTWLQWNQIPVTLGNILAGVFFTGVALYVAYPEAREHAPQADESGGVAFVPSAGIETI